MSTNNINNGVVVIIGAGPAGLVCALQLMKESISPLILEKKPVIRSTACGEACGLDWLNRIPFGSDKYICRRLRGAKLVFSDGLNICINRSSATLDRTNWLRGMVKEVEDRGGSIRLNSEVVAIDDNTVQLKSGQKIGYEVLIGADGPNSRVATYLGVKHRSVLACQYKLACETSKIDYLEFYIDKRFSPSYAWVFPKDGVINVGIEGNFAQLDAFLAHRGLDSRDVMAKEAGIIPASGIQKLVGHNVALIGDAAGMTNPFSGSGLPPIINAAQILAKHIRDLGRYESNIKRHPIAAPVLLRTRHALLELGNRDLTDIMQFVTGLNIKPGEALRAIKNNPSLILKAKLLLNTYRALHISRDYGW